MDSARVVSFAQERLWFLDQLRPGAPDYLLPLALRVRGALDVPALTGAFQAVADRHEVLRTRFTAVDGEPVALVAEHIGVGIEREDATDAADVLRRALGRPFDLATGPPFRIVLARLGPAEHLLVFVVHHIAFDGVSWSVLARELADGYRARTTGDAAEAPPPALRYTEFAAWQRERCTGEHSRPHLDYWRERLAGVPPLDLPTDHPRPENWSGTAGEVRFDLPAALLTEVDRFARARRATRFMVLLAVFQALLGRAGGRPDFAVGVPVAGRTRPGTGDLLGLFVNNVVVRADLTGAPTFEELLARVRTAALGAFSHAEVPFERIVAELAPDRDLSRSPLYQAAFSVLELRQRAALPGLDTEFVEPPPGGTAFELFLDLSVRPDGTVHGVLQYAAALYGHARMVRFAEGYTALLRAVLAEPGTAVGRLAGRLDLLPPGERHRLLHRGNGRSVPVPDRTVAELFGIQASVRPAAVALRTATATATYRELDAAVNRLAHHLAGLGVGPGSLVAVVLDRGPRLLTALLAVLRAGAAYVPIDPGFPARRVEFLVEDSGARLVLAESATAGRVPGATAPMVLLDREQPVIDARPDRDPGRRVTAGDLAYVIYTSGSTGTPKGVLVHHGALTNFALSVADRPGMAAGDPVLALTTISFDPSVLELFAPLLTGATVVLADAEQARDPERMAALIERARPAVVQATPTTLRMLADAGWRAPAGLTVLSGGEKIPAGLVPRLAAHGAVVWDLYGPTETTVWATSARLRPDGTPDAWAPQANYTVYVLDGRLEPVPDGTPGELYVGGTGVALGYLGRPAQTAAVFRPDPHGTFPGARLYRTGDLARRRPDGSVEIIGRADRQVKIRGHRMEPSEIEAVLVSHPGVRAAAVRPTPGPGGEPQLTAYLLPRGTAAPPAAELRGFLLERLPDYMVPAAFVPLADLPRTPSGKVDHAALPLPGPVAVPDGAGHVSPRTEHERTVADIWQEVLGSTGIGAQDSFFDIGGHSLLATRVAVRLRARLGIDVPVRALFDHRTVAALAAALPGYPRVSESATGPVLTGRRRRVAR